MLDLGYNRANQHRVEDVPEIPNFPKSCKIRQEQKSKAIKQEVQQRKEKERDITNNQRS
jgi:hypothetical protein